MTIRVHHFTIAALLTVGVIGCATHNPSSSATAPRSPVVQSQPQIIEGQVIRIESDAYVIREQSGRESRILLDKNTVKGNIDVGDTVIARFNGSSSNAYASSVRRSTSNAAPRSMNTSPRPRTVEGIVQQLDGNSVVIREGSGRDVRLYVNNTTRLDQNIRVGDRVVAKTNEMAANAPYATYMYRLDGSQMIQGELLRGDEKGVYVVRDVNGRERTLQVDNTTRLNRDLRGGDQVVAINATPATSSYETDIYSMYKRPTFTTTSGEVIRVDPDGYVVRDVTGRDVRVQVDSTTLRNENIRVGDRIVADTGSSYIMHADSIERR